MIDFSYIQVITFSLTASLFCVMAIRFARWAWVSFWDKDDKPM